MSSPVLPAGFGHAVGEDGLQEQEQHAGGKGHARPNVVQHLGVIHLWEESISVNTLGHCLSQHDSAPGAGLLPRKGCRYCWEQVQAAHPVPDSWLKSRLGSNTHCWDLKELRFFYPWASSPAVPRVCPLP